MAVMATWWTSLPAPFELDDHSSILANETIRRFPSLDWTRPPATGGETVSGRPVLNFSFALDHAVHGLDVRGFRLTNVLIHAAAALVLFGIVRRTLIRAKRNETAASWTALAIALIWSLHPLQTAAVTYVVQRAESLAGVFHLLTLYGFIRGAANGTGRAGWFVVAALACGLGMLTKETVATAPLVVLLYDRAFVSGSFRAAWQGHGRVHAALFASWIPLVWLVFATEGRGGSAGFEAEIGPGVYFLTQCAAIVRYLRLAFWPAGQVFDYGAATTGSVSEVWMQLAFLLGAGAIALGLAVRNRAAGFLAVSFFLLLAPSSSFVPVATQTMAEHRMYLALAPIVALAAAGLRSLPGHPGLRAALAGLVVAGLAAATIARNAVHLSEVALWSDTVRKRPENARAQHNLGRALHEAGEFDEAASAFRRAIALQPNHALAHYSLGTILASRGEWQEALAHLRAAVEADTRHVHARINLGKVLMQLGRDEEARAQFEAVLRDDPAAAEARASLAGLAVKESRFDDAERYLDEILREAPESASARYQLGILREKQGDRAAAERELREAVRRDPSFAPAQLALGNLLARAGDLAGAAAAYQEALRVGPPSAETQFAWGNLLAKARRIDEAMVAYHAALAIDPAHVPARNNLANALLVSRRFDEAVREYEEVLRRQPDNATARGNLQSARELQRAGR